MSDSEDSTVTYTEVSNPFEDLLDIGSPGVDGLPMMPEDLYAYVEAALQAPTSPDYVPGPEYPPSPDFVPEPVYPEFMPQEDNLFPAEEQPPPAAFSPTADSPGYITESDPEEDLEEDDEDPDEDPGDYPIDRDDDDKEEKSSGDDADDEEEDEDEDEEEEEEHLAPADSILPPICRTTARIYEVGESSSAPTARPTGGFRADYGFVATLDDEIRRDPERDVGYGIKDTNEIYGRLDDAQDDRSLMSGRLNMLFRDRRAHARTALLMEREARLSLHDADRNMNGDDSHNSGTDVTRTEGVARETVGHDVAYAMTWTDLKKKMTDKYCPRGEIKKLEAELWNLKVKGTNVIGYNQHFQELALLCVRMFPGESNKIERYVGGLPNMIHRSVVASNPKTMQEAIEIATELMDKKIRTFAER
ncbi:reverse transcriptase domain-containing protein [Tanacetum coccineum]